MSLSRSHTDKQIILLSLSKREDIALFACSSIQKRKIWVFRELFLYLHVHIEPDLSVYKSETLADIYLFAFHGETSAQFKMTFFPPCFINAWEDCRLLKTVLCLKGRNCRLSNTCFSAIMYVYCDIFMGKRVHSLQWYLQFLSPIL